MHFNWISQTLNFLGSAFSKNRRIHKFYCFQRKKHLDMGREWEEWEFPSGNNMGIGISEKWEWEGIGIDSMGMGGSGNVKSHSWSSLIPSSET